MNELERLRARVDVLEAELRRAQAMFAGGPVVLFRWVAAEGWPVEHVTGNTDELFGHSGEDFLTGRVPYSTVIHPDDLARVEAEVEWNSHVGRTSFEQDYRIVRADGAVRWLYDYTVIVREPEGTITHYDGYVLDISARHDAEAAVRIREEELRRGQKMEALGRLAGSIAHDFNNMLTVMLGHAELAVSTLPESTPLRAALQPIVRSVDRASALTRQLLAFSRHQVLEPRLVELSAAVRDASTLLGPVLGSRVALVVDAPDELWVTVDPVQLEQVLVNLVLNGRDASPEGGRLAVTTEAREVVSRATDPVPPGRWAVLSVRDEGFGMDPTTLARLFEPFFTTKGQAGTGLGLSTAYGIVRQSNGWLLARSTLGHGATFEVWLPLALRPGEVVATPAPRPRARELGGSETVLLVEDHREILEVTTAALVAHGYGVLAASDGLAALELVREGARPDLLVTDLVMPRLDGAGLIGELVALGCCPPVVLMSGYVDGSMAMLAGQPHVFVQKPFTTEALIQAMRCLLAG